MNNLFAFMQWHPVATVFLAWPVCVLCVVLVWSIADVLKFVLEAPFKYLLLLHNRRLRARNIRLKGWPPPHLDADGDAIVNVSPAPSKEKAAPKCSDDYRDGILGRRIRFDAEGGRRLEGVIAEDSDAFWRVRVAAGGPMWTVCKANKGSWCIVMDDENKGA